MHERPEGIPGFFARPLVLGWLPIGALVVSSHSRLYPRGKWPDFRVWNVRADMSHVAVNDSLYSNFFVDTECSLFIYPTSMASFGKVLSASVQLRGTLADYCKLLTLRSILSVFCPYNADGEDENKDREEKTKAEHRCKYFHPCHWRYAAG